MDRQLKSNIHTFVICAYKESAYLEECILSLTKQSLKSSIIMVTSTPNEYISELADKYEIPLFVNEGESGIAEDWNFGISKCHSRYATIAHQDDIYEPDYLLNTLMLLKKREDALIAFTDYGEIRDGERLIKSKLIKVKKLLLTPMKVTSWQNKGFFKKAILSMGNSICCPSVTYCLDKLNQPIFKVQYGSNLDWQTWSDLAVRKGSFVYVRKILMYHRIHEESATSGLIENHERAAEDREMLEKFWPAPIAKILSGFYSKGEKLNEKNK